jgi:hypothetical protein
MGKLKAQRMFDIKKKRKKEKEKEKEFECCN